VNRDLSSPLSAVDRELFKGAVISLGYVRCAVDDPCFSAASRVSGYRIVFPRQSVWIRTSRGSRYRSDASIVEFHNDGDEVMREPLDPRGDSTEWLAPALPILQDMIDRYDLAASRSRYPLRLPCAPTDPRAYADQRVLFRFVRRGLAGELAIEEAAINVVDRILARAYLMPRHEPFITRNERAIADRTRFVLDQLGAFFARSPATRWLGTTSVCGSSPASSHLMNPI
jgi:hypothetical protein